MKFIAPLFLLCAFLVRIHENWLKSCNITIHLIFTFSLIDLLGWWGKNIIRPRRPTSISSPTTICPTTISPSVSWQSFLNLFQPNSSNIVFLSRIKPFNDVQRRQRERMMYERGRYRGDTEDPRRRRLRDETGDSRRFGGGHAFSSGYAFSQNQFHSSRANQLSQLRERGERRRERDRR